MFKSAGLAKMFAGRRKFFRGPHVRHLWFKRTLYIVPCSVFSYFVLGLKVPCSFLVVFSSILKV